MPRQVPWRAVAECVLAFATGSRAEAAEHAPIRKPLVAARSRASRVAVAAAPCRDGAKRAVAVHACRARHAQRRTQREHRSPTVGRRRHAPAPLRRSTPRVACHGSCRKLRRASAQRLLAARPCGTPRGARTGCITLPCHASRATACSRRVRQSRATQAIVVPRAWRFVRSLADVAAAHPGSAPDTLRRLCLAGGDGDASALGGRGRKRAVRPAAAARASCAGGAPLARWRAASRSAGRARAGLARRVHAAAYHGPRGAAQVRCAARARTRAADERLPPAARRSGWARAACRRCCSARRWS